MNKQASDYYDKFSRFYDWLSPKFYYHRARQKAVDSLDLEEGQTVLNVPVGTGQNIEYFQKYLGNTGQVIGIDISEGMLSKAFKKIEKHKYTNVSLEVADVASLNRDWLSARSIQPVDAILCDLGLSGFDDWESIIDDLLGALKPDGRFVVMDWLVEKPSLRGEFVKWIGGGEVDRPIPNYLEGKLKDFELDHSYNRGGVFVASGNKPLS